MNLFFKFFVIFLLLAATACNKNKQEVITTKHYYNDVIYLTEEYQINKVERFNEGELLLQHEFTYSDSMIREVHTWSDRWHSLSDSTHRVYMLENDLIVQSYDTSFTDSLATGAYPISYEYDSNNYLIYSAVGVGNDLFEFEYIYSGGNRVTFKRLGYCDDTYTHNDQVKKINLENYLSDYFGTLDKNLRDRFYSGCHSLPGTAPPSYKFSYVLNSAGLIVEMIKTSTFSPRSTDDPIRETESIISFEYVFQ